MRQGVRRVVITTLVLVSCVLVLEYLILPASVPGPEDTGLLPTAASASVAESPMPSPRVVHESEYAQLHPTIRALLGRPDGSELALPPHWRRVVDRAVEALWAKAPARFGVTRQRSREQEEEEKRKPHDFRRMVERVVQFIDGRLYIDQRKFHQLPIWESLRLQNLMYLITVAQLRGANFTNFEMVVTGSDCPCDWTHCFCTVTCGGDHPQTPFLNFAYPQWFDHRDGPLKNVDSSIKHRTDFARSIPWQQRSNVAVFRGVMSHMTTISGIEGNEDFMYWLNSSTWQNYARGKLLSLRQEPDASHYLNVNVAAGTASRAGINWHQATKDLQKDYPESISMEDQVKQFKYAIYAEGSCGWADRLKMLLALGLVPLLQETRCMEWYTQMLEPWVHYIPVDGQFNNLTASIRWAQENDGHVKRMSKAGIDFASNIISRAGMVYYVQRLIQSYIERLDEGNRPVEPLPYTAPWNPDHVIGT